MDNFVIPAITMKELEEQTIRFLKIAEKHNLCFKWSKCDFNIEEIPILKVVIGKGQVKIEQKKNQSSHGMEDTDKGQGCRKLPRICKFLQKIYLNLQSYGKAFE